MCVCVCVHVLFLSEWQRGYFPCHVLRVTRVPCQAPPSPGCGFYEPCIHPVLYGFPQLFLPCQPLSLSLLCLFSLILCYTNPIKPYWCCCSPTAWPLLHHYTTSKRKITQNNTIKRRKCNYLIMWPILANSFDVVQSHSYILLQFAFRASDVRVGVSELFFF